MSMIKTVLGKANNPEREIRLTKPPCLEAKTLTELVKICSEEIVLNFAMRQMVIAYRSAIRTKLEERDDNGEFVNSDAFFQKGDFAKAMAEWKPKLRIQRTDTDKAADLMKGKSLDEINALIEAAKKMAGAAK